MAYTYNENKIPNLGHLKDALTRAHGDISDLAALVVGTLEEMIIQEAISIPTSAWVTNQDSTTSAQGYSYKAEINVTGLIENANVNVTLDVPSLIVAQNAGVCPTVIVSAGKACFLSMTVPSSAISGTLDAIQLAEDDEGGDAA